MASETQNDTVVPGTAVPSCKFCKTPLKIDSIYCTECKNFQTFGSRVINGLSLASITSALPVFALVAAFLNQNVIFPYSKVRAVPIECQSRFIVVGLSNSGTRSAVVGSGLLHLSTNPSIVRDVFSPSEGAFVLEPAKTALVKFDITHYRGEDLGPLSDLGSRGTCTYDVRIAVMEFNSKTRRDEDLSCSCPF